MSSHWRQTWNPPATLQLQFAPLTCPFKGLSEAITLSFSSVFSNCLRSKCTISPSFRRSLPAEKLLLRRNKRPGTEPDLRVSTPKGLGGRWDWRQLQDTASDKWAFHNRPTQIKINLISNIFTYYIIYVLIYLTVYGTIILDSSSDADAKHAWHLHPRCC